MSTATVTELTPRQRTVYEFVVAKVRGGLPPTNREIGAAFGINSPNGVRCHLKALERKGFIAVDPSVSRGIRLARRGGGPCPACGCSCGGAGE